MGTLGDILLQITNKPTRRIIGLMSGTSYDGVDAALVRVTGSGPETKIELEAFLTLPYQPDLRDQAFALSATPVAVQEFGRLDAAFGKRFAEAALKVIQQAHLTPHDVDLICCTGAPMHVIRVTLGSGPVIAEMTGVMVLDDLRASDAAAGGNGAPLSPYADWILFHHESKTRIVQNIGGIGNLGWLPADRGADSVIGFDTGPGNMVIDALARVFSRGAEQYDTNGQLAASGTVHVGLLEVLLAHPFIDAPPPKAASRTHFGEGFTAQVIERARRLGLNDADIMATATMLTAESIARNYERWIYPQGPVDEVILGGGGAHNQTLVAMLKKRLDPVPVRRHEDFGIDGDAREAISWAIMANETLFGRPSNLPRVTGARHPVVLGRLSMGNLAQR